MTGSAQELSISTELTGISAVIVGVFVSLFGSRLLRVTTAVAGTAAGTAVGMVIGARLPHCSIPVRIALTVGAGLAGLLLALLLFRLGLFILGASAGVLLTRIWQAGTGHYLPFWVYLVTGVGTGLLVLLLQHPVLILLTAFGGAGIAAVGAHQLLSRYHPPVPLLAALPLAVWMLLGITGSIVQAVGNPRKARQR
ncbi:MAG: DUF4203 domain-containing protein [candidate division WOR-3 bacterium]